MPFMAVWKSDPSRRMGRKSSRERNTTRNAARKLMAPLASCHTAMAMPTAAPT